MNIAFAGFRHSHIVGLYSVALENGNVIGCYEENEETRTEMENSKNVHFNYNTYDELLNSPDVDAVAIGDYYQKRGKLVIEALKHGKHVICDKPMCTSLEELDEIERLSRENNLTVACMLDLRYWPQSNKAKELIENGEIGRINMVSFTGQHPLSYGSRPQWYFEEGKHGGTINDIAIHGIDVIRYITGKNLTRVDLKKEWNAYATEVPHFLDSAQFVIDMNGTSVMADVSYAGPACNVLLPTYWEFRFWGSDGMLTYNFRDKTVTVYKKTEEVIECEMLDHDYFLDFINDFIKETKGEKTRLSEQDMLESQRQVLTIQKHK